MEQASSIPGVSLSDLIVTVIILLFLREEDRIQLRFPAALGALALGLTGSTSVGFLVLVVTAIFVPILWPLVKVMVLPEGQKRKIVPNACPKCGEKTFQREQPDNPHWWKCSSCQYQQGVRVREKCPQCLAPNPSYFPTAGFHTCGSCGWEEEWEFEDAQRIARIVLRAQAKLASPGGTVAAEDYDEDQWELDDVVAETAKEEFNVGGREKRR